MAADLTVASASGEVGSGRRSLVADTVYEVAFDGHVSAVVVLNMSGQSAIAYTLDGTTPAAGGLGSDKHSRMLPAAVCSSGPVTTPKGTTTVKLRAAAVTAFAVQEA